MASKRPGEELQQELTAQQRTTEAISMAQNPEFAETQVYREPIRLNVEPAPAAASAYPDMPFPVYSPARVQQMIAQRAKAAQFAGYRSQFGPAFRAQIEAETGLKDASPVIVFDPNTGGYKMIARQHPLQPEQLLGSMRSDPLVGDLAAQYAKTVSTINALKPIMTEKQKSYIGKRLETITHVRKGRKAGTVKTPTTAQLQKVLMRAHELAASRRRAQMTAQVKRARAERHALVRSGRTIYTPNGTVGYNRRHSKKLASNAIKAKGIADAKAEAKAGRANITAINKQYRRDVAAVYNRKPPKEKAAAAMAT